MDGRITAQRWTRIESLLDAVLTLPPDERNAFLARHSGEDADLHGAVRDLLAEADEPDAVLDRPGVALVHAGLARTGGPARDLAAGSRIGAWRLRALVGRGGMGEVYRVERADGAFEQAAALKLVQREAIEHLERFHEERRLLARLDHPGIARLLDGGVAPDGRPYMVMEWVDGAPLGDWARASGAGLRARLDVFLQVCDAVAHAHRNLLVHRDLKPANVLVTADGRAKLLDFGVAKLLTGPDDLALRTRAPVTPAYAAPEQLAQGAVTPASDVFALGLLLFELLTGERPWYRAGESLVSLAERLLRQDAPSASRTAACADAIRSPDAARGPQAASPNPHAAPVPARALRGDLDAIVACALRREPERRYASAAGLADDLRRHLDGRAVLARPDTAGYTLRRLMRRNPLAAGFAALALLALCGGLALALWQAREARAAAALAQQQASRASVTRDFLVDVFRASDPRIAADKPRGAVTARELLDLAAPRIGERFAADPDAQIELLGVAATIYRQLGEDGRYGDLHAQQAALARQVHGELHPAIIEGLLDDAHEANERNDYAAALERLAQADPLIQRADLDDSATRARWWLLRSDVVYDGEESRNLAPAARAEAVRLYARHAPDDPGYVRALSQQAFDLARTDPAGAEKLLLVALDAAQRSPRRDDADLQQMTWPILAQVREDLGNHAGALDAYDRAAALAERTRGTAHSSTWVPAAQYAWTLHRLGQRERAHARFAALLAVLPEDLTQDSYDEYALEFYADRLAREGRAAEAIPLLEHALATYIAHPGVGYEQRRNRLILGDAYDQVGRTADARAMLEASLQERIELEPAAAQSVLAARERWGRFLAAQGDAADAQAQFDEVLLRAANRPIEPAVLARAGLARLALARGDLSAALRDSEAAARAFDGIVGRHDVRSGPSVWLVRAAVLRAAGDHAGAREWARRALEASRRLDAPQAPSIAAAEAALRAAG